MKIFDRRSSPEVTQRSAHENTRAIEPFQPPPNAVYGIEITSHLADVPRRTILVYCKHRLLSPVPATADHGYYFNGNAVRTLRRIEALRTVCGDDLAGIKIILDLTAAVERLRSDIRLLSRRKTSGVRDASTISSQKRNAKSNYRRKRK